MTNTNGYVYTTVRSGSFDDPNTWDGGRIPPRFYPPGAPVSIGIGPHKVLLGDPRATHPLDAGVLLPFSVVGRDVQERGFSSRLLRLVSERTPQMAAQRMRLHMLSQHPKSPKRTDKYVSGKTRNTRAD